MKIAITFLITALIVSFTINLGDCTTSPSSHQSEEYGWLQNGKPVPDSDNIKSKNGFGAQLWIINDESFFDQWNKPETPNVPITKTAIRNKPVFIIILFINPGLDQGSKANVTTDITIKSPDGNIYGEFKEIEIWQRNYLAPRNSIQLAVNHLGIKIEDNEQLGVYKIEATIKDKLKNIVLELTTDFTAKEN